jgi:hypothetical protein
MSKEGKIPFIQLRRFLFPLGSRSDLHVLCYGRLNVKVVVSDPASPRL